MSKIADLLASYREFISIPWAEDVAPDQRVIFGVYDPQDELKLRASIGDFEIATKAVQHDWLALDIEKSFSNWLSGMKYKEEYFKKSNLISAVLERYITYLANDIKSRSSALLANANAVVAIYGVGSIYGLAKVRQLVDMLASAYAGRLLVFFPGSYEDNNYRLLNGYDGWNYRAIVLNK